MLRPLGDKLIIQIIEEEEKKAGSILLPSSAKERPQEGQVIAVGNGLIAADGKRVPLTVAVGDTVIFSKYAGTEVKYEGQSYLILRESDILVIV